MTAPHVLAVLGLLLSLLRQFSGLAIRWLSLLVSIAQPSVNCVALIQPCTFAQTSEPWLPSSAQGSGTHPW